MLALIESDDAARPFVLRNLETSQDISLTRDEAVIAALMLAEEVGVTF